MTRLPWMPLYIAEYLADTGHLSTVEHGAYLLLIMHYWQHRSLPTSDNQLSRIARMTQAEWEASRETLSGLFGDGWTHKRIDKELAEATDLVSKRSAAGKAGAYARHGNRIANAQAIAVQTDTPLPSQEPKEERRGVNNFVVGRGGEKPPMTDQNKLALFQKWLATSIGRNGWQIVGTAADPTAEGYEDAVAFCRAHAKKNGKGWPHKWPTPELRAAE